METYFRRKRLLVAVSDATAARIEDKFAGHYDFELATTFQEAVAFVNNSLDGILCALDFAGGVFELLRYSQLFPETKNIPFISIQTAKRRYKED